MKNSKLRVKSCGRKKTGGRQRKPTANCPPSTAHCPPPPPFSVPLLRAASDCGEIGRRLLGLAAALERIGRTGKALEVYPHGVLEELTLVKISLLTMALNFDAARLNIMDEIDRLTEKMPKPTTERWARTIEDLKPRKTRKKTGDGRRRVRR